MAWNRSRFRAISTNVCRRSRNSRELLFFLRWALFSKHQSKHSDVLWSLSFPRIRKSCEYSSESQNSSSYKMSIDRRLPIFTFSVEWLASRSPDSKRPLQRRYSFTRRSVLTLSQVRELSSMSMEWLSWWANLSLF